MEYANYEKVHDYDNTVETYSYDVYGQPDTTSSAGNPYIFTGRRLDEETGLYYYRARHYDPSTGRFLQTDSISLLGRDKSIYLRKQ